MKVAHIGSLDFTNPTGTGESVRGTMAAAAVKGIDSVIYALGDPGRPRAIEQHVTTPQGALRSLGAWLREDQVDLVHFHGAFVPALGALAARLPRRMPYVVTPHGGYVDAVIGRRRTRLKRLYLNTWERPFLARAAGIVAMTEHERSSLKKWTRTPVHVVPNTYDPAIPDQVWQERQETVKPGPLLFLGRGDMHGKGLDRLLHLSYRMPNHEFRLHLTAQLDHHDDVYGLQTLSRGNLFVMDPVYGSSKASALRNARAYTHLARWESFGMSIVEAAASGLPLVLSPDLAITTSAAEAGAALVLDSDEARGASELVAWLDDEAGLVAASRAARSWASANFHPEKVADMVERLYAAG